MTVSTYFYLVALVIVGGGGNILLSHLGSNTVPSGLAPLADRWKNSGGDPKWIRRLMWVLFGVCAFLFFGFLIYFGIYQSMLQLGTKWTS